MIKNRYIQKIIGVLLISLFAISITPVNVLHELAANHKDSCSGIVENKTDQLLKYKLHCHYTDFVAESPFLNNFAVCDIIASKKTVVPEFYYTETFFPEHYYLLPLRGPPAFH